MDSRLHFPALLGDIGGTHARFGLVRDLHANMELFEPALTNDFVSVQQAVEKLVLAKTSILPKRLVLAAAGPLIGGECRLTNSNWVIKPQEVIADLGLASAQFMNDFPAQALAVLTLDRDNMHRVGGGEFQPGGTRLVVGPGTSFGIATAVKTADNWTILPAEGACADFGLGTSQNAERELHIQGYLQRDHERQTVGSLICGPGLENLYQAIGKADKLSLSPLTAAQISGSADTNATAAEAVGLFCALLGRVAGDLALNVMATGGVYLTGGMAYKMLPQIERSTFREEFERKAPQNELAKTIPTWFINREHAALEGLANYVRTPDRYDLSHASENFVAQL